MSAVYWALALQAWEAAHVAAHDAANAATVLHLNPGDSKETWDSALAAEREVQAILLRDLFGNPFRPLPPIDAAVLAWNGGTVIRLAEAVYEDRDQPAGTFRPARLAVLADALEEAGYEGKEALTHLREQNSHWRGCWVLDLLLNKD
jgi:hypothetical protein